MNRKGSRRSRIQFVVVLAALAVALALIQAWLAPGVLAQEPDTDVPPASTPLSYPSRTITVVGQGSVKIKPDIARVNIGVETSATSVISATAESAVIMDALIAALKGEGVAEVDIQTSGYSVWLDRVRDPTGAAAPEPSYRVQNNVSATIRDLDRVGAILDSAIEAGANSIGGVSFGIEDPSALESQARRKAVTNARAKAAELAQMNGLKVGPVISISEIVGAGGGYYSSNFATSSRPIGIGGAAGPITPGELELALQLQITYALESLTGEAETSAEEPAAPTVNVAVEAALADTKRIEVGALTGSAAEPGYYALASLTDPDVVAGIVDGLGQPLDLVPAPDCTPFYQLRFVRSDGSQEVFGYSCRAGEPGMLSGAGSYFAGLAIDPPPAFHRALLPQVTLVPSAINVVSAAGLLDTVEVRVTELVTVGTRRLAGTLVISDTALVEEVVGALNVDIPLESRVRCTTRYQLVFVLADGQQVAFGYGCEQGGPSPLRGDQFFFYDSDVEPGGPLARSLMRRITAASVEVPAEGTEVAEQPAEAETEEATQEDVEPTESESSEETAESEEQPTEADEEEAEETEEQPVEGEEEATNETEEQPAESESSEETSETEE